MAIYEFEFSFPRAFLVKIYQKRFCQSRIEYSASYVAPNCDIKQCTVITTNDKNNSRCMSVVGTNSKETEVVLQLNQLAIDVSKPRVKLNLYEVVDRQLGFLPSPSSSDLECPTTLELVDLIFPISFLAKCVKNKAGLSFQQNAWYQGEHGAILPCLITISSGSFSDDDEQRVLFLLSGIDVSNNPTPISVKFMITGGLQAQMPNIPPQSFLPVTSMNMLTTPNAENTMSQQVHVDLPCSQNNNAFVNQPLIPTLYSQNDDRINDIKHLSSSQPELGPQLTLPGAPDMSPGLQFSTSLASSQSNPSSDIINTSVNTSTPSVIAAENAFGGNNEGDSYNQAFQDFVTNDFSHKPTNEIAEIANDGSDMQDNAVQHTDKETKRNAQETDETESHRECKQDAVFGKIETTSGRPYSGTKSNVETSDEASLQKDPKDISGSSSMIDGERSLLSSSVTFEASNAGEDVSCTQTRGVNSDTTLQESKEDETENSNWSICGQSLQDIAMSDLSENETVHLIIGSDRKDGRFIESKSETGTVTDIGDTPEKILETVKQDVKTDSKINSNPENESNQTTGNNRSISADVRVETKLSSSPKPEEHFMDIVDPETGLIESVRVENNDNDNLPNPDISADNTLFDDSMTVQSQQSANNSVNTNAEKNHGTEEEYVKNIVSHIKKISNEEEERQKLYTVDKTHSHKSKDLPTGNKKETFGSCKEFDSAWLEEFPWLKYDPEKQKMFCKYCIKAEMTSIYTHGCGNINRKSVRLHAKTSMHIQSTHHACRSKVIMRLDPDSHEVISTFVPRKPDQQLKEDGEKDETTVLNDVKNTGSAQDCQSSSPENVKSREPQSSSPENVKSKDRTPVKLFVPTKAKVPVVCLKDASKSPEFKKYFKTDLSGPLNISRLERLKNKLKSLREEHKSDHSASDVPTSASDKKNNRDVQSGRTENCTTGEHLIEEPSVKVENEEKNGDSEKSSKIDEDFKKKEDADLDLSVEQSKKESEDKDNGNSDAEAASSGTPEKNASVIKTRRGKSRKTQKKQTVSKKVINEEKNGDSEKASNNDEDLKKKEDADPHQNIEQCEKASEGEGGENGNSDAEAVSSEIPENAGGKQGKRRRGEPLRKKSVSKKVMNEEKNGDGEKSSKVDEDFKEKEVADLHQSVEQCKKSSEDEDIENAISDAEAVSSRTCKETASVMKRKQRGKCRRGQHFRNKSVSKEVTNEKKNDDSGKSSKVDEGHEKQNDGNWHPTPGQCKKGSDDEDSESCPSAKDIPTGTSAKKSTSGIKRGRQKLRKKEPSVCVEVEEEEKDSNTGKCSKVDVDLTVDECEKVSDSPPCEPKEQETRRKTVPKCERVKPENRGKHVHEDDDILISYLLTLVDCDSEIPAESMDTKPWRPVVVLEDIGNNLSRTDSSVVKMEMKSLSLKSETELSSEMKSSSRKAEMKPSVRLSEKSSSRKGTKRKSSKVVSDEECLSADEEGDAFCVPHVDNVLTPPSFSDDSDFETEDVLSSIPSWEDIMKSAAPESEPKSTLKPSKQSSSKFSPLKWESTAEPLKRKLDDLSDSDDSGADRKSPVRKSDKISEVFGNGSEKPRAAATSSPTSACDMMSLSDDFDLTDMMMCHVVLTRCDR